MKSAWFDTLCLLASLYVLFHINPIIAFLDRLIGL